MADKRTIYYTDELNDDFAGNDINTKPVTADFKFARYGFVWRVLEFLVYYVVALPLVFLTAKIYLGLRFENRKALKAARGKGFFLYGNHTRNLDAYVPCLAAFPRRAMIVCNPDAVSIPGIRLFVQMLGALPLPSELGGMMNFMNALFGFVKGGRAIAIFPEAHIWPFYTGIRPFKADSFCYPMKNMSPVYGMFTRYKRRKGLLKTCPPAMTVTISEPFYPDAALGVREGCQKLRDQVYGFMLAQSQRDGNYEYIHYEKKCGKGA